MFYLKPGNDDSTTSLPKRPKRSNFKLVPNSQVHLNKANNATEVYDLEGAYWEFEIELANVPECEALMRLLQACVAKWVSLPYLITVESN